MRGKRAFALAFNPLIGWIIAFIVLALMIVLIMVLKEKGMGVIEFIKNIFTLR